MVVLAKGMEPPQRNMGIRKFFNVGIGELQSKIHILPNSPIVRFTHSFGFVSEFWIDPV